MESTPASLNSLSLQLARVIYEPDHFRFYQQLTALQTRLNALTLDAYSNYFYRSKPLGSAETPIYGIISTDDSNIGYFLVLYINSLTSKSKKLHSKLLEIKASLVEQLTYIQASITSMLATYACPMRARLYCNADSSWIYFNYQSYTHLFYQHSDDTIRYAELTLPAALSTSKDTRGNRYYSHREIASIIWPEDNL